MTSRLSEAVEQAARTGEMWFHDVAGFAKGQADRVASGHYGLTDLSTAQVALMRICVRNGVNAMSTVMDNLALLSSDRPAAGPATRTIAVAVPVPADPEVTFEVSDLAGSRHQISHAKVRLDPSVATLAAAGEVTVLVEVDCTGAPADTYAGTIFTGDQRIGATFLIAIDELGGPVS